MSERVFTDEELMELGTRTLDLLNEAIEVGDKERSKKLAQRMYDEAMFGHDVYVDWISSLLSTIYRRHGAEELTVAVRAAKDLTHKPGREEPAPWTFDFKKRCLRWIVGTRMHQQPMTIEEDDEKVTITACPCGSGQRQMQLGKYENYDLCKIQEPLPITKGKIDYPIYCTHDAMGSIIAIERWGYPDYVSFTPEKHDGKRECVVAFYKRLEDIPEEAWTMVGKQKPK